MQVRSRLDGLFARDPDPQAAARAIEQLGERAANASDPDRSHGAVTSLVALDGMEPVAGGLFDPAIFGGGDEIRYGHVEVHGISIAGHATERVPIPPLADRPLVPIDDPAARLASIGPINEAWTNVLAWAARQRRVIASRADRAVLEHVRERVQAAVDDAIAVGRGDRARPWPPPSSSPHELVFVRPAPAADEAPVVRAMVFLDDQRLLVQTGRGCLIVGRDGREELRFKPVGTLATSVHGARVVFAGDQRDLSSWYGEDAPWPERAAGGLDAARAPIAVYDTGSCRWLARGTVEPLRFVVDETDVQGTGVLDLATQQSMWLAPQDLLPTSIAHTRDGRFAWLAFGERPGAGLVYELVSATPFVEPLSPPDDLPAIELGPPLELASAMAWHPARGWRFLHPCGAIGDHARSWARVVGARAAAFSPDAGTIAIASDDEIRFVSAEQPSQILSAFEWRT